jgi:hypothetical protein
MVGVKVELGVMVAVRDGVGLLERVLEGEGVVVPEGVIVTVLVGDMVELGVIVAVRDGEALVMKVLVGEGETVPDGVPVDVRDGETVAEGVRVPVEVREEDGHTGATCRPGVVQSAGHEQGIWVLEPAGQ